MTRPISLHDRRRAAGVAVSLGVHAAVLLALVEVAPRLLVVPHLTGTREARSVRLELAARSASGAPSMAAAPTGRSARASLSYTRPRIPDRARLAPADPALSGAAPAVPRPAAAAGAAPGPRPASQPAGAPDDRWRVTGVDGDADAAARALARGTVGCGHEAWLALTAAERERCESRFVEGARSGLRADAVPAAKRAYFDQVRDAYAKMHEGAPLPIAIASDGGVTVIAPAAHGAHLPGFGCSPSLLGRKPPPHSLKLGPCVITPPSGLGTEEADVVPPPSAGAQRRDAAAAAKFDAPAPPNP